MTQFNSKQIRRQMARTGTTGRRGSRAVTATQVTDVIGRVKKSAIDRRQAALTSAIRRFADQG